MHVVLMIFNALVCIFEMYMLYDFYDAFYEKRRLICDNGIVVILLFSIVVYIINLCDNTIINLAIVPMIYIMLGVIGFVGSIYKRIFTSIMAIVIMFGAELGVIAFLNITAEEMLRRSMINETSTIMLGIIVKLMTYIIFIVVKRICKKSEGDVDVKSFALFLLVPISTIGVMFSVAYCGIDFEHRNIVVYVLIVSALLMVIGNVSIYWQFNKYADTVREKEEVKTSLIRKQLEAKSYQKLKRANEQYMCLLHDTNHYLKNVRNMVKNRDVDGALNLLDSLGNKYEEGEKIEYSSNAILNTILSDYKRQAREYNIKYDVFVERGFNVEYVDEIDLVSMISNILSNAFEATLKCEKREVKIQMYMNNEGWFSVVRVSNSFNGDIVVEQQKLQTTKRDKGLHGTGIKSINNVAKKYNGYVQNN